MIEVWKTWFQKNNSRNVLLGEEINVADENYIQIQEQLPRRILDSFCVVLDVSICCIKMYSNAYFTEIKGRILCPLDLFRNKVLTFPLLKDFKQ